MLKTLLIDLTLWMADRRNAQGVAKVAAADWWRDLSEAIEEGVSLRDIQARRSSP